MSEHKGSNGSGTNSAPASPPATNQISAPTISLPKGGGAIRGMGEKFAANPVTGTGSMSVPIATSPGRSGFGPQLSLSYDSGAGNGPFGLGWNLSLPSITRKTDKGLPKYQDAEEWDVFILSGAEDLVPVLKADETRYIDTTTAPGYTIRRYRPRIEGLFARIERWTDLKGVSHWRSISKDNITTWYGKTTQSRIADPSDQTHIFSWLICESYDDKGNAIVYEYKEENSEKVDTSQPNERNRVPTANRYLKRIKYGNRPSRLVESDLTKASWMFEVVFDYGDHDPDSPTPKDDDAKKDHGTLKYPWPVRQDPFSTYRAGFEVRTYRRCRRVLMFHHIPDLLTGEKGYDGLVRSTEFDYADLDYGQPVTIENELAHRGSTRFASFIRSVTQSGHKQKGTGYLKKSLPPVEFEYTKATVQDKVEEVDAASLENLPIGVDGSAYQWTDLHGEGIPGILTEQAGAWFYKRNLSPISERPVEFAPLERVAVKPNLALAGGAQFMDLAGDGLPDLVVMDGPMPGLYEHDEEEGWQPFCPFTSRLNRDMRDPNMKFVDLDGDGHADVLITEDDAFVWHPSLAEEGFGSAYRVAQALDEEKGPRLVFADGTQSIYLADLSGDGLTDLVRIRNGEVCYWPNQGYGRFGAKVTMDHAPQFDNPDQFDHKRIRLADIDGSGTTDIIYLHRDGVRLYFNQSGNGWSEPQQLNVFPRVNDLVSIVPTDLLGNGTACLVWSSPLPGDARRQMRYVDLMGGQKPHLLVKTVNNLGAETSVQYASSIKFYLQDKRDGKPWITKLPFPVHVVEKVTVTDKWRQTKFASTYSYHHGYFDGIEREFRGFGRVEQVDVESYGEFKQGNAASPYITDNHALYQPPVKTVTWYHTGAAFDRDRILSALRHEYVAVPGFTEHQLPEPTLTPADLSDEEWREALRACKGMALRQEVFELDVDALDKGTEVRVRLFTTAYHNSNITRVQPQGINRHAVFLVTESEAIIYNYELDLQHGTPDPRIAHTLNLKIDELGNILESVAAVYPRIGSHTDASLTNEQRALINQVEKNERHLALNCTGFTEDIDVPNTYRLRMPCQTQTWELTGIRPAGTYFTLAELKGKNLSSNGATEISYHQLPGGTPEKRLVECARTLFFADNLKNHRPFRQHGPLGLPYESYKLGLTKKLINSVYVDAARITTALSALDKQSNNYPVSGYYKGDQLFAGYPITPEPLKDQFWIASGIAGFAANAKDHFYLPEEYTDPFGNKTTLTYDDLDLFIQSSTDALGNKSGIAMVRSIPADPSTEKPRFDYRVLAPIEMVDINGNHTEVYFDILGMVVASAVKGKGKGTEGDDLSDFNNDLANPPAAEVQAFCTASVMNVNKARTWLGRATARFVYHFGEDRDANGTFLNRAGRPAGACGIVREIHVRAVGGANSPLQVALECSDGSGNVLMKKVQAEPEPGQTALRWIINGLTVLNNKGKPVKQYEPSFSKKGFGCEMPPAEGVTPVMYYDAPGRLIRTDMPDGSFSRVEFSPWHVHTFDQNDTAYDPDPINPDHSDWFKRRTDSTHPLFAQFNSAENRRAAELVKVHANTPALTILDSLGRAVITVAHNKFIDRVGVLHDEKQLTFTKLDAEGKPLWICDARGNVVMQYITPPKPNHTLLYDDHSPAWKPAYDMPSNAVPCYDIAGNLLFQHSMDAGDRWMINDAAGKPMLAWDMNETPQGTATSRENRFYTTDYDKLHRPTAQWLTINSATRVKVERYEHQDAVSPDVNNLNGQLARHYDPSGLVETIRRDFKGNVQEVHRTLTGDATASVVNWNVMSDGELNRLLEQETYVQLTEHDALNRMTRLYNWHLGIGSRVAVYEPKYNERAVLVSEELVVRTTKTAANYDQSSGTRATAIQQIQYNAKGQKTYLKLGNGTMTRYEYDPDTFRLIQLRTTRPNQDPTFPGTHANLADPNMLQQLHYTYDPVGNITEIYDEAYERVFFQNQQVEARGRYEYDSLYRLISSTGRENGALKGAPTNLEGSSVTAQFPIQGTDPNALRIYAQTYQYDSVGNIERMHHEAGNGTWTRRFHCAADSNRLLATWDTNDEWAVVAQNKVTPYDYDTHGNMLNLANVASGQHLQWDHRDMIKSLDCIGGGVAYYQYDSGKQRTRKRIVKQNGLGGYWERIDLGGYERYRRYNGTGSMPVEEIESHHLVEGKQRVLLVDDVVTAKSTTQPGPNGLGIKKQTLFRYQYSNHLGSACLELDHRAGIISYEEYHPYGTSAYRAMASGIEVPPKRYRYTGKERDEESGLNYHGARYYAPWVGRWGSTDSVGVRDGPNLYVYVVNNPIRLVDPNGRSWEEALAESEVKAAQSQLFQTKSDTPERKAAMEKYMAAVTKQEEAGFNSWAHREIYFNAVLQGFAAAALAPVAAAAWPVRAFIALGCGFGVGEAAVGQTTSFHPTNLLNDKPVVETKPLVGVERAAHGVASALGVFVAVAGEANVAPQTSESVPSAKGPTAPTPAATTPVEPTQPTPASGGGARSTDFYGTSNGNLVPSRTPKGFPIQPHIAERMGNPPASRREVSAEELDILLEKGEFSKMEYDIYGENAPPGLVDPNNPSTWRPSVTLQMPNAPKQKIAINLESDKLITVIVPKNTPKITR